MAIRCQNSSRVLVIVVGGLKSVHSLPGVLISMLHNGNESF